MNRRIIYSLLLITLLVLSLDGFLQFQLARQHRSDQILDVSMHLSTIRARIEKNITSNLLIIQGAANFIAVTPDMSEYSFARYASTTLSAPNLLKNLTAAPDYVMQFVYPLEGNEAILGMNYRDIPDQWENAHKAEESKTMVVAGPLKLVQGGTGLIGRAPVFVEKDGEKHFWGIVSSIIDIDILFEKSGLNETVLNIAIRETDGKGNNGAVFLGDSDLFRAEAQAVLMPVSFPAGAWVIAATPKGGWSPTHPFALLTHVVLALLAVAGSIARYRSILRNHTVTKMQKSLNNAQAIAHLGHWELDHATSRLWWSDETYRILGVSKNTYQPTIDDFFKLIHPDDRVMVEKRFAESLSTGENYSVDHRIIRPCGSVHHVQERGETTFNKAGAPLKSTGTILDITDRIIAEEALRVSEERMRAMAEASYDALIMINSDDIISYWSPAAERMFGWSHDEAMGQSMHHLIVPKEKLTLATKGLEQFSRTGKGLLIGSVIELIALRKNGDLFPVEVSVSAFQIGNSYYAVGSLRDITQRKEIEHELRDYADRLALASKVGNIGIWELDIQSGALTWDDQMLALYRVDINEFNGLYEAWRNSLHPEDLNATEISWQKAVSSGNQWDCEFRIVWPDGEVRYIKAAAQVHKDEASQHEHMIGVNWDVTEARLSEERLRLMATTDSMTGLYNRRRFLELASREIERSRRFPAPFSIIMFDADKFKLVNDNYGHDVGDMVLKSIASTVVQTLRDVDIVGRLGGEEFAAGLPGTDTHGAMQVAERMREAIEKAEVVLPDGRVVVFTVSLGVAALDESCAGVDGLLKRTDLALYQAKENGRNRVEMYDPQMEQKTEV